MNSSAGLHRLFKGCPHVRGPALILALISLSLAEEVIRVAKFRGNLAGAVSYTFDDGMREFATAPLRPAAGS